VVNSPLLFAVTACGSNSEKEGAGNIKSSIPGITRLAAKRDARATEKNQLYGQALSSQKTFYHNQTFRPKSQYYCL
jgi:hypothetical protein